MTVTERYWDDASVGDEGTGPTYTVTKEAILAFADLSGDHTPVHVDEEYANASHFGGLVAHGLKTQSESGFLPGMSLGWTWDFVGPIMVGDELRVRFRVASMRASNSRPDWGIVVLATELIKTDETVVQRGEHRLMVPRRPGER